MHKLKVCLHFLSCQHLLMNSYKLLSYICILIFKLSSLTDADECTKFHQSHLLQKSYRKVGLAKNLKKCNLQKKMTRKAHEIVTESLLHNNIRKNLGRF